MCQKRKFCALALAVDETAPYRRDMGRSLRLYARGVYHVAGHGSDDRVLFRDDVDRHTFLDHLAATFSRLELGIGSYVLMTNHHHLIVSTPDDRIARGLQDLHGGYSRIHNRRHGRKAHLFRAHAFTRLLEDSDDLIGTDRYVARNPVEAGVVLSPFDWPWSSAAAHAGLAGSALPLDERRLRGAYENTNHWRRNYYAGLLGRGVSRAA